jgi:hypothetical protein
MRFLPLVVRAQHRGDHRIHVVFNDKVEATVDCETWLQGPVFEPLKDPRYFSRLFVDAGAVVWPNGADIAPETLYEAALSETDSAVRPLHHTAVIARESRPVYKSRPKRRRG